MATFNSIFPTFLTKCGELHTLLLSVAFALFVVGVIATVSHHASHKSILNLLLRLLILTSLLVFLPAWGNTLQNLLQTSILSGLGVDPSQVYQQFNQLLVIKRDPSTQSSWWNVMAQLHNLTTDLIISAVLWLVGQFASLMMFWAYIFQNIILNLGYALSPLLIGFMAIPALKHTGNKFLLNLVGFYSGRWAGALAALVTQGILDFMTDPSFEYIDPTSTLPDLQKTIGVAVVAFWIIFSTVAAPVIIQNVIAHGIHPAARCLRAASAARSKLRQHGGSGGNRRDSRHSGGHRWRGGHGGVDERHVLRRQHGQCRGHHHRRYRPAAALRARPARRRHHRQQGRPRSHRQIQTQLLLTYGNI